MAGFQYDDDSDALFDSTYLRWHCLQGYPALCEIIAVDRNVELTLPGGKQAKKPVVTLKMLQGRIKDMKPLVLNRTNAESIAEMLGRKPSKWIGKQIVLYQAETKLKGKLVPCIRVRAPKEQA